MMRYPGTAAPKRAGRRSPVAQLAERPTVNRQVAGSSPAGGANTRAFSPGRRFTYDLGTKYSRLPAVGRPQLAVGTHGKIGFTADEDGRRCRRSEERCLGNRGHSLNALNSSAIANVRAVAVKLALAACCRVSRAIPRGLRPPPCARCVAGVESRLDPLGGQPFLLLRETGQHPDIRGGGVRTVKGPRP